MDHDVQTVRTFEHPGAGRRRAKATPKGRQVDPTAAHEIELLLGDRPRFVDFDLYGMLENFLYSGHYKLPKACTSIRTWHRRMTQLKPKK